MTKDHSSSWAQRERESSEKCALGLAQCLVESAHVTKLSHQIRLLVGSICGTSRLRSWTEKSFSLSAVPPWVRRWVRHTCPAVATTGLSAAGLKKDAYFLEYLPCNFYRNKNHSIKTKKPGNFLVTTCFLELAAHVGAFQDVSSCPCQVRALV